MKVGDLVRMKHEARWRQSRINRCDDTCIIYGIVGKGIKVLLPDGKVKVGLADHWEVVSEAS